MGANPAELRARPSFSTGLGRLPEWSPMGTSVAEREVHVVGVGDGGHRGGQQGGEGEGGEREAAGGDHGGLRFLRRVIPALGTVARRRVG